MPVTHLESWIARDTSLPGKTVLSRTFLEAVQKNRLLRSIELMRSQSPWHRKRLRGLDLPPDLDLPGILSRLPFMSSADLQEHGLEMLCCSQADIEHIITLHSSGTKTRPKRIFFTDSDLQQTSEFFRHGMRLVAIPKDRVLIMLPAEQDNHVGSLLKKALMRSSWTALTCWPAHDHLYTARIIRENRISCLIGLPQHILPLARDARTCRNLSSLVNRVLLCSDYAAPAVRLTIAQGLNCRVHLHYGSTESGLGGAVECLAGAGCHIRENHLLFEVIDPVSGQPLPEGCPGELVMTTLSRTGMPFLRYRTGDLGQITRQRCACGSILARLQNLQGRLDNFLQLPSGGCLTMPELDQAVLSLPEVLAYNAVLRESSPAANVPGQSEQTPSAVLELTVNLAGDEWADTQNSILQALDCIPALKRAWSVSDLELKITFCHDIPHQSHTVKRVLVHERHA